MSGACCRARSTPAPAFRRPALGARIEEIDAPLLVCEPVLAETMYLLARYPQAQDALMELLDNGALEYRVPPRRTRRRAPQASAEIP